MQCSVVLRTSRSEHRKRRWTRLECLECALVWTGIRFLTQDLRLDPLGKLEPVTATRRSVCVIAASEGLDTNAARCSLGELDACLEDAGPFCDADKFHNDVEEG